MGRSVSLTFNRHFGDGGVSVRLGTAILSYCTAVYILSYRSCCFSGSVQLGQYLIYPTAIFILSDCSWCFSCSDNVR